MNRYLVAIYEGNNNSLSQLLATTTRHDYRDITAALAVVLADTERSLAERLGLVEQLLIAGADPNGRVMDGDPLLCRVCALGEEALVQLLIEYACDVNERNHTDRKTPLHVAANKGHEDIIGRLLEAGASTNAVDTYGDTPLMDMLYCDAMHTGSLDHMTRLLLVDYTDVNYTNMCKLTPLHIAAATDKLSSVGVLLSHGASVNQKDLRGEGSLFPATRFGQIDTVRLLIEAGANLNQGNTEGNTPLHEAVMIQRNDLLQMFIHHNAFMDIENNRGNTPLIAALESQNLNAVKFLIQNNCNVNITGYLPKSPSNHGFFSGNALQLALFKQNWIAAQMLMVAGCRFCLDDLFSLSTRALERLSLGESGEHGHRDSVMSHLLQAPSSLRLICRVAIRNSLTKTKLFHTQLNSLNLPKAMKEFLELKELDVLWPTCSTDQFC